MEEKDELILAALGTIASHLERIAIALESAPRPAPDIVKDLSDYPQFDWQSINAEVVARDNDGAVAVRHQGKIYIRRNPQNKYGPTVWYSRATGKENDEMSYERLITFKEVSIQADPIPQKTSDRIKDAWREKKRSNQGC